MYKKTEGTGKRMTESNKAQQICRGKGEDYSRPHIGLQQIWDGSG